LQFRLQLPPAAHRRHTVRLPRDRRHERGRQWVNDDRQTWKACWVTRAIRTTR